MSTAALLDTLIGPGAAPCFAVLDGARRDQVHTVTQNFARHDLLLDGVDDPALLRYAPRVVELGPDQRQALEVLLARGFGDSWGYFVRSPARFRDVRDHLAGLLVAELPDGSERRFRLFDPRVLRAFLPTCTPAELAEAFGPITSFLVEAPEPGALLEYGRDPDEGGLSEWVHALAPSDPPEPDPPPLTAPRPGVADVLKLRDHQVWLLEDDARARLLTRAAAHLGRHFPGPCAALGPAQMQEVLDYGLARAGRHGFETERELAKYLNLMFAFGRDFDREQPWAVELLAARAGIDQLYAVALLNENRALGRV